MLSRGAHLDRELLAVANEEQIAVFRTPMVTMRFINAATIAMEVDFSPTVTEFGSMVDILGIGVLIRGASGIGKSECVLGLIERGYSLVADDVTRITSLEGRELMATAPELTRYHMEVRGIGIINIASIFGIGSIRIEKRLDLVVTLKDWQEIEEVDRIGLDQEFVRSPETAGAAHDDSGAAGARHGAAGGSRGDGPKAEGAGPQQRSGIQPEAAQFNGNEAKDNGPSESQTERRKERRQNRERSRRS